jgi:hypothetical protein
MYDGLTISTPIWWAIYIGPQQQKQPDGGGPGCMLYPLIKKCDTQPRVTIRNITLKNIRSTNGVLPPGIIRCNETNPCSDIKFENVYMTGWFTALGLGYITEYAVGSSHNVYPDPGLTSVSMATPTNLDLFSEFLLDYFKN